MYCILHLLVSAAEHPAPSFPMRRGHVPFYNPLLIPRSFQNATFIQTNPFLSFLEQSYMYRFLLHEHNVGF